MSEKLGRLTRKKCSPQFKEQVLEPAAQNGVAQSARTRGQVCTCRMMVALLSKSDASKKS